MKEVGIYCRTLNENFFIQEDKVFVKKELAGDVLQAYWITKNIIQNMKDNNLENLKILPYDPNLALNHFFGFYIHLFYNFKEYGYLYRGKSIGITANYTNFFFSKFITSNSLLNIFLAKLFLKFNQNFIAFFSNFINRYYFKKEFSKFIDGFLLALKNDYIKYFVFNSNREKDFFINLFKLDKRVYEILNKLDKYVIYNCLDFEEINNILLRNSFLNYRLLSDIAGISKLKLLFVGRFDRIKNILNLIKVYKKERLYRDFILVILGYPVDYDLNYYKILKDLTKDNKNIFLININDFANFYYEKRYLTLKLMGLSDIVILPSLEETFSLTALEALYFNKKLIITQNSPYYELYPDLINIFVFPIDPFNLKLREILEKINLNFSLQNLKDKIASIFNCKEIAKHYLEIFQKYS